MLLNKMIIFYIMIVTIAGTDGKSRLTDRCPSSILQWKRQESLFSCPADAPYHCILKYNTSQLYEACIATVTIGPGVAGCPWILFHQGVPIHGSRNSECPISNPECPPANHNGYLSNQLYQYPACFMQRSARSSHGYDIITSELPRTVKDGTSNHTPEMEDANESQRNIYIALGISVLVIVIVILSVAFCLFKRVCRSHEGSSKRNVNEEDETIDMIDKGQLIPEKGNGTIQSTNEEEAVYSSNDVQTPHLGIESEHDDNSIQQASTSNTNPVIQRSLRPTSDEHVQTPHLGIESEHDVNSIQQDVQTPHLGIESEHDVNSIQQASTSNTNPVIQRSLRPTSDENVQTPHLGIESEHDVNSIQQDINLQQSGFRMEFQTSTGKQDLGNETVETFSEDMVKAVFFTVLGFHNGIADFFKLLGLLIQKDLFSDLTKEDIERLLRCNSTSFRVLEDSNGILFVIAYSPDAEICEKYNKPGRPGECTRNNCKKFHLCLFNLKRICHESNCNLSHTYTEKHNRQLKETTHLHEYSDNEMDIILLNQYPKVCSIQNCKDDDRCPYLHVCIKFCDHKCNNGSKCPFGHSFDTKHNAWILMAYGIPVRDLMSKCERTRYFPLARNKKQTK